jgi:uncharacterized protein (TIGR04255 family)
MTDTAPFTGPAPAEVPLPRAPLVRVIAQVRFPPILAIDKQNVVSGFQEAIRADYPVMQREDVREINVGPLGDVKVVDGTLWRFADAKDEWRVSLSTTFVALETRAYSSRTDFIARLDAVVQAADESFRPQVAERVGIRYINRVEGAVLERLHTLIRSEMLGATSSALKSFVRLSLAETHLKVPEISGEMLVRYGLLPPKMTYDPAVDQVQMESWVLDIDTFRVARMTFDPTELSELAAKLAEQSYRLFRWVVNDDFLREYGAVS